jgi:tRNA (cmo5U34)-methyltransferase
MNRQEKKDGDRTMAQQQTNTDENGVVWEIPGHHWQERDRVDEYVARTTERADRREHRFSLMCDLMPFEKDAAIRVLDIGAGYGAVAAVVLERFPNSTAVGLDLSQPMMEVGRERMARFGGRFDYCVGDFADGSLPVELSGSFDAAVASASIHHLPSDAKQRLYGQIFAKLNPGGCFFNVDTILPVDEDTREWYIDRRRAEREREQRPASDTPPHTVQLHHHFETVPDQLAMLRAAGFAQVDCFYKELRDTIIGGFKPRS